MPGAIAFFVLWFGLLTWQWWMIWLRRGTLIPLRYVWMLSSLFFIAMFLTVAVETFPGFARQPETADWFVDNLFVAAITGVFLCFTIPLWLSDRNKPPRKQTSTKCDDEPPY